MKDEYALKVHRDFLKKLYYNRPKAFYKDMICAIIKDFRENNTCSYLDKFSDMDIPIARIERSVLFELKSYYLDGCSYYFTDLPMIPVYNSKVKYIYFPLNSAYDITPVVRDDYYKMASQLKQRLTSTFFSRCKIDDYVFRTFLPDSNDKLPPEDSPKADDVNNEYNKTLQSAKDESEKIIREAKEQAQRIKAEAESEAKRLEEEAKVRSQNATEISQNSAQAIIRKTIDDYQQQIQDAWNQETDLGEREDERYRSLVEAKREFIEDTTVLKRELRDKMKDFVDEMRAIQDELEIKVNKRQTEIYHHEFTKIADCFGQLYIIVRKNPFLTDYIMSESDSLSQNTLEDLKKLKSSLNVILKKLEGAMASLGMIVYYPEPGDRYDDIMHDPVMTDDEGDPCEMVISECQTPGIMRKGDTAGEDEPVIRAVVSLERKGDE